MSLIVLGPILKTKINPIAALTQSTGFSLFYVHLILKNLNSLINITTLEKCSKDNIFAFKKNMLITFCTLSTRRVICVEIATRGLIPQVVSEICSGYDEILRVYPILAERCRSKVITPKGTPTAPKVMCVCNTKVILHRFPRYAPETKMRTSTA